jgi:deoxyribodipyrimidine photo-lyase
MHTILWFRQDLRLDDNPALGAALTHPGGIVPVYLHAPAEEGAWPPGGASRWWLHHSLQRLGEELERRGSRLCLSVTDDSLAELLRLARLCGAERVVWNRRYEPAAIARDRVTKGALRAAGLSAESYSGALLNEPWAVRNKNAGPFQVFTPFWRHCLSLPEPAAPTPAPERLPAPPRWPPSRPLGDLALLPRIDWAGGFRSAWVPGSIAAQSLLQQFLAASFSAYPQQRNRPDLAATSRLSPHLHFGEISPRQIWHATRLHAARSSAESAAWRQSQFLAEVGWREFAYHLLYHFPATPLEPLRSQFSRFPWRSDEPALRRWQRGLTGFPLVDAGMRELWNTGWMHNRVRMIAGSFLVKDLLLPWQAGARWFWDTLVDADLASNTLGWQWVAGCGADAAPYFRIFNPVLQGKKFDPEGAYVRRWIPQLARLPNDWIHEPWAAPPEARAAAGVVLGDHYPHPIVNHERARMAALAALAAARGQDT